MNSLKIGERQNLTLDDWLKPEKLSSSNAGLHHEVTKAKREEELVKYMSNVPSYLERGKSHHEKVLNVGVLDWGRLEKYRNSRHSVSITNSSSTNIDSDAGPSCSHTHQSASQKPLHWHFTSSQKDNHHESLQNFQDVKGARNNTTRDQGKFIRADKVFYENCSELPNRHERRDMGLRNDVDSGVSRGKNPISQKCKRVTLLMPKDPIAGDQSLLSGSTKLGQEKAEAGHRVFFEMPFDISPAIVGSDVPHSCPLPREIDECKESKLCYSDSENDLPKSSQSVPNQGRVRNSSLGAKKSFPAAINPNAKEPSSGLDPKLSKGGVEKTRSISPFRRLTIGMPKIGKANAAKFPSDNTKASSSSEIQSATSRARSSPLKRLLDPLLKPKAVNNGEPSQTNRVSRSSNSSTAGIVKFDMASCTAMEFENPSREKKLGSTAFHALLRVAVKNGQPLFTFAVDNQSEVLAATLKKLSSSSDDEYNRIYTFFAIGELKKKNGRWISQGGKGKSNDYVPNIVAQLKVSGSRLSTEDYMMQEFVLFAVDLGQSNEQAQPNNELAAIVVKIPKMNNNDDPELRSDSSSRAIDATVILPSGVHTLPNKGGPSSLIQRWRSGGSCDCGGWDLGCKLRVFSNQNQLASKFELIAQGGEEENRAVFSLASFKDGIYSVEFTSSLTILQALSLCIAVLDSRKLCETSESNYLSEGKTSLEDMFARNDDMSVRYVSYPPHSPVGRA